jgi:hypothetical protein
MGLQLFQDAADFRVKFPDTWFRKVFVRDFEKIIAIEFA